jgi:hypothetical protein
MSMLIPYHDFYEIVANPNCVRMQALDQSEGCKEWYNVFQADEGYTFEDWETPALTGNYVQIQCWSEQGRRQYRVTRVGNTHENTPFLVE